MKQRISMRDRPYFREAMASPGFAFSDFQIGRITGKPTLVIAHRLRESGREPGGVVFVALDLIWLNKLLVTMDMPDGAAITVIDSKGTVFARHPDAGLVGKHFPNAPLLRAILDRPGEGKLSARGLDGVQRLYAHATLLDTGANRIYITLGMPDDIVYAPVRMMLIRNILILSVIALLVFAIAWWGSDVFVLRQARALTEAANRLRRGEPGSRTRLPHDRTELGQLAQTFDTMAADLELRQKETEQTVQQLRRVNRALATLSAGNRALVNATEETTLLQDMCRIVVENGGYRMAWVGLAEDGAPRRVQPVAHAGLEDGYLATLDLSCADEERGQGPACTAIRAGHAQAVRDIATDVHFAPWRAEALKRGYVSCLALPLHFEDQRGVLVIYSDDPNAFGGQEFELLQETANDLSFGIVTLRDRIKQRQKDETIHRMAYTDTVTGLASRLQLEERLHDMLRRNQSCRDRPLAVIMLRIERFREINNALGHPAGDALLRQVGERLRGSVTGTELVARNGSRDFAVLLPDADAGHALQRAHELRALLNTPFTLGDLTLDAQASAGVALCPGHGTEPELLLRHASQAVDQAPNTTDAICIYQPPADEHEVAHRLALTADLRQAIEQERLLLFCQPKIDLRSQRVCGAESLARWP
ncbi:MAG: diguanylate cyclase, partial [Pseudomonadota bacterium]